MIIEPSNRKQHLRCYTASININNIILTPRKIELEEKKEGRPSLEKKGGS